MLQYLLSKYNHSVEWRIDVGIKTLKFCYEFGLQTQRIECEADTRKKDTMKIIKYNLIQFNLVLTTT